MSAIDDIHAKLQAGDLIDATEALMYAQHHMAKEREACAKIADDLASAYARASDDDSTDACIGASLARVAKHIRNRSGSQ